MRSTIEKQLKALGEGKHPVEIETIAEPFETRSKDMKCGKT